MRINYYTENNSPINIYEFAYSAPDIPINVDPYVRNVYLLHIVTNGICHFCDFEASEGSAFIIVKNKLQSFHVEPGYSHYWFAFDGTGTLELFEKYGLNSGKHMLLKISNLKYLKYTLENAMNYAKNNPKIARSIFHSIFPLLNTNEREKLYRCDEIATTAKKFIDNNYQRKISMEDVAKSVCVSEKYLCAKFKQYFSIPPQQYLQSVRMKNAKILLKNTNLKIKEISDSAGYESQLSFSSAFKKYIGTSPSDYREKNKN